ncbi:adenylyltransferase/sulfurtransferase [Oikeobacillus pervagus]|uniref:Adenylyltransferase/sulfurtransferase n=1 Tax=Oikeobacillus pervagus TaxID=1325931 RepID=A0AAJ1T1L2_9BACI|nr:thiazole biosynthesis adenylyltransferase ThiF [Oikeobacillus pervagus]MDQ0215502.1 adenylyltransferase/sulfurtransferase [Oikeobacillus pervagus]
MNDRYSRQQLFTPIGKTGQEKIRRKHVLLIGAGALGTASAEMLVRAGIGKITLVDRDYVEYSNLQRQQLYTEKDAEEALPKVIAAKRRLQEVNSEVEIEAILADMDREQFESLLQNEKIDVIMDATDNFDIRLLINDISQKFQVPWVYGACVGSYGVSFVIIPNKTPCLHCLLEQIPLGGATCDTAGIISPAVQIVASFQTAEALKILTEHEEAIRKTLLSFDLWKNEWSQLNVASLKKADCPSCGENKIYPYLQYENETKFAILCGRNSVQIRPSTPFSYTLQELSSRLQASNHQVRVNPYLLSFSYQSHRIVVFKDSRVFIHGCKNLADAKKIYYEIFT